MAKVDDLKKEAQKFFSRNKEITCPAFPKEKIIFNSKGLHHLFYDGTMRARPEKEIEARVLLLPQALKLVKLMPLWQEERLIRREKKTIRFWALEGVVDKKRIKVIIRQKGDGKKCFWSVIPAWRKIDGKTVNAKSDLSKQ